MTAVITVRARATDGRVALWEQRLGHADTWIVADGRTFTVPHTPAVADAIARGVLIVVTPDPEPGPRPETGPVPNVETHARPPRRKR